APIGFELLDAPDMYQYSHSLVFSRGLPTNLTGAMLAINLSGGMDVVVHLTNGWDNNVDANSNKMFGGRLGYSHEDMGGIGFSAMRGDQEITVLNSAVEDPVSNLTVYDIDLTLTPAPGLIIGGEYNYGRRELEIWDSETKWNGYMVMAHYSLTDVMGLTGRYDYFNTSTRTVTSSAPGLIHTFESDKTHQALTVAPTFALTDGLGFLMELRRDFADAAVFGDPDEGEQEKSMVNFAFEMTYSF
ncbi:MAG: outer membrane beta-barrel protein, partial [Gemmatimonadetes bacterium]|nr:outer membrane beta-barrel protein [Gemmatimonadota bacterium]